MGGRSSTAGARPASTCRKSIVIRPSGKPVEGVRDGHQLRRGRAAAASWSCSAFKPQKLDEVAPQLQPWLTAKTVVISILAGVEAASLRERFPERRRDRPRDAQSAGRDPPRRGRAVQRGRRRRAAAAARRICSRRSASRRGWPTKAKLAAVGSVAGAGPGLCRAVHRRAGQGGREARARAARSPSTIALETVLGTAWMAAATNESMDRSPAASRAPRARPRRGLPCSTRSMCSTSWSR